MNEIKNVFSIKDIQPRTKLAKKAETLLNKMNDELKSDRQSNDKRSAYNFSNEIDFLIKNKDLMNKLNIKLDNNYTYIYTVGKYQLPNGKSSINQDTLLTHYLVKEFIKVSLRGLNK